MEKMRSIDSFKSLPELIIYFNDEKKCLQYLEEWIWGGTMRCPHCGTDKVYRFKDGIKFKCSSCKEHFTAKVGTIFESSKLPMMKWITAIYLICSHKKGISSHQLARTLSVTQKTAWFMLHRLRKLMEQKFNAQMDGIVMSDETFVGGKNRNRHKNKKAEKIPYGRNFTDKTPVMGLLQAGGEIRTFVIKDTTQHSLLPIIRKHVAPGSIVVTDEWRPYVHLKADYDHQVVIHKNGNYQNAAGFSTNAVEGFWSQFKRAITGIWHNITKRHLHRYVDEITFKFNTRLMNEGERLKFMLQNLRCRLKYKQLILKT